jgi:tellurium resistance protein TerZ
MSISLSKNEKLSLSKVAPGLQHVFMGLGWDSAKPSGFFGKLFNSEPEDIDLDASCLMFDSNKEIVDTIWFRQLHSKDGSVIHTGDNRTGDGDGDDEVIKVDLSRIPSNVTTLVFVITSFTGQTFDKIDSAFCRIVDSKDGLELAKYSLSEKSNHTAQIMAKVYREKGEWIIQAIGSPTDGTVQTQLYPAIKKFL